MEDKRNLHKKMQEQIDCHLGTDYLTEINAVKNEADQEQASLKWLALAVLYAVNENAKKIKLERDAENKKRVIIEFQDFDLPTPGDEVLDRIFDDLRQMTHIEEDQGKTLLSVGIRDSSVDLEAKLKKEDGKEKIVLNFPEK